MSPAIESSVIGLISFGIKEWIDWNARKTRAAEWKPTQADIDEFLAEVANDTPENVRARVAASLGKPYPKPVETKPPAG